MALHNAGVDRFINGMLGEAVAAAASVESRLHTLFPATIANELSGNGYGRETLTPTAFTRITSGVYRRLQLPALEWFADASSQAQTAQAISLTYGNTLAWDGEHEVDPENDRVYANAGDIYVGIEMSDAGWVVSQAAMDAGLRALAGEAIAAGSMFWELHSGAGTPSASNRLTGGGIDGVAAGAWTLSDQGTYRRATQAGVTISIGLTADTNAQPTRLALWNGRPESSGVLHAYRPISPDEMTEDGSRISIPASGSDSLYVEVNKSPA